MKKYIQSKIIFIITLSFFVLIFFFFPLFSFAPYTPQKQKFAKNAHNGPSIERVVDQRCLRGGGSLKSPFIY